MTKTVFISGSIGLKKLSDTHKERINRIISRGFRIVIGDANGADLRVQKHLSDVKYPYVDVYYTGDKPRNNVGDWKTRPIQPTKNLKGALLHQEKDKSMVSIADYALIIWDGESVGSIINAYRMSLDGKQSSIITNSGVEHRITKLDNILHIIRSLDLPSREKLLKRLSAEEREPIISDPQLKLL
ncbi:TPA: hypothetical protein ACPDKD_000414 [Pasteurella multocida]